MIKKLIFSFIIIFSLSGLFAKDFSEDEVIPGDYTGVEWLIDADDLITNDRSWWEDSKNFWETQSEEETYEEENQEAEIVNTETEAENNIESEPQEEIKEQTAEPFVFTMEMTDEPQEAENSVTFAEILSKHLYVKIQNYDDFYQLYLKYREDENWQILYSQIKNIDLAFDEEGKITLTKTEASKIDSDTYYELSEDPLLQVSSRVMSSYLTGSNNYKKYLSDKIKLKSKKSTFEDGDKYKTFAEYHEVTSITLIKDSFMDELFSESEGKSCVLVQTNYIEDGQEETEYSLLWLEKTEKGYKLTSISNGMKEFLFFVCLLSGY